MNNPNLIALGWDTWFADQASALSDPAAAVARVAAVDRDQLLLLNPSGVFRARLAGKLLYDTVSSAERPCVGDWVYVDKSPADQFGLVHGVLARKTCLRRKAAGEAVEVQMIAANVDAVIVVQSCHYDFNLKRLERYLVMARDGGTTPCILLTKTDLVEPAVVAAQVAQIRSAGIDAPVLTLSNLTRDGMTELQRVLDPGKTYCFVGSSGVGKSTLINGLIGRDLMETNLVSDTGEGRHTTVRRELIILANGAMVIDNPGMREFGVLGTGGGIEASYADIIARAGRCRFRDCTHTNEPGCAVAQELASGEIDTEHYENFLKLKKESAYHDLSYAGKRKKDKEFGRFIKSVKKGLKEDE
ncbi:ribosome small subunit-dependent GTPase A [uncultured Lamprocystis sp.]|jgi:ribosome biogenesis GTPase|uniref:ribosome small subunit-dependent GTPase A n=1 Tax=uncultured Lamprocystis sp. TaxID=543132 RepID=UPI0025EEBB32|nr:ribosome small subunit-dependent GTPase A [uncultured Lamprocystis sp.]